jgi:hypothetical protein
VLLGGHFFCYFASLLNLQFTTKYRSDQDVASPAGVFHDWCSCGTVRPNDKLSACFYGRRRPSRESGLPSPLVVEGEPKQPHLFYSHI